jgi:hypothetical protein
MNFELEQIEETIASLIVAIDEARERLPRGASQAEQKLRGLCATAERLIGDRHKRIDRRISQRGYYQPRPTKEEKQEADLKQQVIDAGFRSMATKLHPDAGGTHEDMVRLNQLRHKLRG